MNKWSPSNRVRKGMKMRKRDMQTIYEITKSITDIIAPIAESKLREVGIPAWEKRWAHEMQMRLQKLGLS